MIAYSAHRGFGRGAGAAAAVQEAILTPNQTYNFAYPVALNGVSARKRERMCASDERAVGSMLVLPVDARGNDPVYVCAIQSPDFGQKDYRETSAAEAKDRLKVIYLGLLKEAYQERHKVFTSDQPMKVCLHLLSTGSFAGKFKNNEESVEISFRALREAAREMQKNEGDFDDCVQICLAESNEAAFDKIVNLSRDEARSVESSSSEEFKSNYPGVNEEGAGVLATQSLPPLKLSILQLRGEGDLRRYYSRLLEAYEDTWSFRRFNTAAVSDVMEHPQLKLSRDFEGKVAARGHTAAIMAFEKTMKTRKGREIQYSSQKINRQSESSPSWLMWAFPVVIPALICYALIFLLVRPLVRAPGASSRSALTLKPIVGQANNSIPISNAARATLALKSDTESERPDILPPDSPRRVAMRMQGPLTTGDKLRQVYDRDPHE